jgi:hypothetical protein
VTLQELQGAVANLSPEELIRFREWFEQSGVGRRRAKDEVSYHDEILVCLDALWNSLLIRRDYERKALKKAGMSSFKSQFGHLPPRPSMLEAKQTFEKDFYAGIYDAIEQLDLLRGGKELHELYKPSAMVVFLGSGKYGVEVFLRRDREPLLFKGFSDPHQARGWIIKNGDEYAAQNGAPSGTKLLLIG